MKKKKYIIFSTLTLFLLMFITHFIYDIFPNFITSLFFPVNESIMEHMKMIYSTYFIFNIILYLFKKDKFNNYPSNFFITSMFNIIIFLIVYLPLFNLIGEQFIITMILLFLSLLISSFISYKILTDKKYKCLNQLSVFLSIIIFLLFALLTYCPIKYYLWYCYNTNTYGIK